MCAVVWSETSDQCATCVNKREPLAGRLRAIFNYLPIILKFSKTQCLLYIGKFIDIYLRFCHLIEIMPTLHHEM